MWSTGRRRNHHEGLVSRLKGGDEEALRASVAEVGDSLRRFFIWRGLSDADAEDLAVNCTSDIVMQMDRFKDQGDRKFMHWCFKVGRSRLVDWYRNRKSATLACRAAEIKANSSRDTGITSLEYAVRTAVASLSERDREMLVLRHFQPAHAFAEISEILGISEGAARVRCHRALGRLANVLKLDPLVQEWLSRTQDYDIS